MTAKNKFSLHNVTRQLLLSWKHTGAQQQLHKELGAVPDLTPLQDICTDLHADSQPDCSRPTLTPSGTDVSNAESTTEPLAQRDARNQHPYLRTSNAGEPH